MNNVELATFFKYNVEGVLKINMTNVGMITVSCSTVFALQAISNSTGNINYGLPMILTPVENDVLAVAVFAGTLDGGNFCMAYSNEAQEVTFTVWQ